MGEAHKALIRASIALLRWSVEDRISDGTLLQRLFAERMS